MGQVLISEQLSYILCSCGFQSRRSEQDQYFSQELEVGKPNSLNELLSDGLQQVFGHSFDMDAG